MIELIVKKTDKGQKLIKYVGRYLKTAPDSFIYKMLRKKNIVLNDKKADGKELINEGDSIKLYLSDQTLLNFGYELCVKSINVKEYHKAYEELDSKVDITYECDDYLVVYKPVGILSQKAEVNDCSLNEWLIGYLLNSGFLNEENLAVFKPSVLNRLDRNTCGLVICSKTYLGSNVLSKWIKDKTIEKYYRCLVHGDCNLNGKYSAIHYKDEEKNIAYIYDDISMVPTKYKDKCSEICTEFRPVGKGESVLLEGVEIKGITEMDVKLYSGKSHQIRAQLSHMGFPLVGDEKYGGKVMTVGDRKYTGQALMAYMLLIPSDINDETSEKYKICVC